MTQSVFSADYVQTALILRIIRVCQAAGSVVVLYDHIINFDREVDHVWNHLLSFGSINYILIRYIGDLIVILNMITFLGGAQTQQVFVSSPFDVIRHNVVDCLSRMMLHSCTVYFFIQSWLGILLLFLIQVTLQVRLYALYQGSKRILAVMIFGYVCEVAAMLTILGFVDEDSQITNEILPGLYICANTRGPSFFHAYVIWLPIIVYDSILCLLAACRGISSWTFGYHARQFDGLRVADVLIKDNVGYFVCILLISIASVVFAQCFGVVWETVSEEFPAPMEVVFGCRLILGLRSSLARNREKEYSRVRDDTPWMVLHPLAGPSQV